MAESAWKPPTEFAPPTIPPHEPLKVSVHLLPGAIMLVHVSGRIDSNAAVALKRNLLDATSATQHRPPQVLLDLSGVTYLDHAGLGALLTFQERVRTAAGTVELLTPSPSVVRLLHEADLDGQSQRPSGRDDDLHRD